MHVTQFLTSHMCVCMLYRQETVSAILSTQISNNDTEEDEDGDLDGEEVEIMIDIGMV